MATLTPVLTRTPTTVLTPTQRSIARDISDTIMALDATQCGAVICDSDTVVDHETLGALEVTVVGDSRDHVAAKQGWNHDADSVLRTITTGIGSIPSATLTTQANGNWNINLNSDRS